jgi:hypothetical protein
MIVRCFFAQQIFVFFLLSLFHLFSVSFLHQKEILKKVNGAYLLNEFLDIFLGKIPFGQAISHF